MQQQMLGSNRQLLGVCDPLCRRGYVVIAPDLFARREGAHKTLDSYCGASFYARHTTGSRPPITQKKVVQKSDNIHHGIDQLEGDDNAIMESLSSGRRIYQRRQTRTLRENNWDVL
jgi:dienelactone hydrolase